LTEANSVEASERAHHQARTQRSSILTDTPRLMTTASLPSMPSTAKQTETCLLVRDCSSTCLDWSRLIACGVDRIQYHQHAQNQITNITIPQSWRNLVIGPPLDEPCLTAVSAEPCDPQPPDQPHVEPRASREAIIHHRQPSHKEVKRSFTTLAVSHCRQPDPRVHADN
jgi:hypothetical protein